METNELINLKNETPFETTINGTFKQTVYHFQSKQKCSPKCNETFFYSTRSSKGHVSQTIISCKMCEDKIIVQAERG